MVVEAEPPGPQSDRFQEPPRLYLKHGRSSPDTKQVVQNWAAHKQALWRWGDVIRSQSEPCFSIGNAFSSGGWQGAD